MSDLGILLLVVFGIVVLILPVSMFVMDKYAVYENEMNLIDYMDTGVRSAVLDMPLESLSKAEILIDEEGYKERLSRHFKDSGRDYILDGFAHSGNIITLKALSSYKDIVIEKERSYEIFVNN